MTNYFIPYAVSTYGSYEDACEIIPSTIQNKSASDLTSAIFAIYEKGDDTADFTLTCDKKRFPAHKIILAARSKVFEAMFRHHDTKEARTNEVMIEDTDPDTLERFLR